MVDIREEVRQLVAKVSDLQGEVDSLRNRADSANIRIKSCERRLRMIEDEDPSAVRWASGFTFHVPPKPARLKRLEEN